MWVRVKVEAKPLHRVFVPDQVSKEGRPKEPGDPEALVGELFAVLVIQAFYYFLSRVSWNHWPSRLLL